MDLYLRSSQSLSRQLTKQYSTSFYSASMLFSEPVRTHVFSIYGLVRIADEIVDSYKGEDTLSLLDDLEKEVYRAIKRGYSANPIVYAFSSTAVLSNIDQTLILPFFDSMRTDISKKAFSQSEYETYIYGSAEVVGLMCLKVFCHFDSLDYNSLASGARSLGSAYQKVNFLRDFAADSQTLGRCYFPGLSFEAFDETAKQTIVEDIRGDFDAALPYIQRLPDSARPAIQTSYDYYRELLITLEQASADHIKQNRIRVPNYKKTLLLVANLRKKYL